MYGWVVVCDCYWWYCVIGLWVVLVGLVLMWMIVWFFWGRWMIWLWFCCWSRSLVWLVWFSCCVFGCVGMCCYRCFWYDLVYWCWCCLLCGWVCGLCIDSFWYWMVMWWILLLFCWRWKYVNLVWGKRFFLVMCDGFFDLFWLDLCVVGYVLFVCEWWWWFGRYLVVFCVLWVVVFCGMCNVDLRFCLKLVDWILGGWYIMDVFWIVVDCLLLDWWKILKCRYIVLLVYWISVKDELLVFFGILCIFYGLFDIVFGKMWFLLLWVV